MSDPIEMTAETIWTRAAALLRRQPTVAKATFEEFSQHGVRLCIVGAMNAGYTGTADVGVNSRRDVLVPVAEFILRDYPQLVPDGYEVGDWLCAEAAFQVVTHWNDEVCDTGPRAADLLEKVLAEAKASTPV